MIRTESLDKRRLNDASWRLHLELVVRPRLEVVLEVLLDHLFRHLPYRLVAQKYTRAQTCLPQNRLRMCANSSSSLLAPRPLISLMISLGAISGGALTSMWTWSALTTPRTILISNALQVCRSRSLTSPPLPRSELLLTCFKPVA